MLNPFYTRVVSQKFSSSIKKERKGRNERFLAFFGRNSNWSRIKSLLFSTHVVNQKEKIIIKIKLEGGWNFGASREGAKIFGKHFTTVGFNNDVL